MTNTIAYLGNISASMGQGKLNESYSTDLQGAQLCIAYLNKILKALGQPQETDNSSDLPSAFLVMARQIGKFLKTVS